MVNLCIIGGYLVMPDETSSLWSTVAGGVSHVLWYLLLYLIKNLLLYLLCVLKSLCISRIYHLHPFSSITNE
jgi:hypothetical protein